MYRIVLCDDNPGFMVLFRNIVKKQFKEIMPKEALYEVGPCFGSGKEVLDFLKTNKVDVIILDIDMPDLSGFELAKILSRKYKNILVVFMSAYDNFVYESFDYLPFAYLRKAHMVDDLPRVATRIRDKLLEPIRYIVLPAKDRDIKIDSKDIMFFESVKNYYVAHLVSGDKITCRGTLSRLEESVREMNFFRTHSAFLVNLEYIDIINDDSSLIIDTYTIPIAQKRTKDFRKAFSEYERKKIGI